MKALGVWAAIAVGGGAVGLLLGGILVETLSWPWIFFVNVPVGIIAFLLSPRLVPESKDEHVHKSFDLVGAVTVTSGLVALVYGIVRSAEAGWGSLEVLGFSPSPPSCSRLSCSKSGGRRSRSSACPSSPCETVRGANVVMLVVAAGLRDVLLQHALRAARPRLLAARGRGYVPAVHVGNHHRGRPLAAVRL